jgi:hypothetical protein
MSKLKKKRRKEGERKKRKEKSSRALVAHAYNPSYSGGRDQED